MKKIASILVLAVILCTSVTVFAKYSAIKTDNQIIIAANENNEDLLILSGYDEDGNLKGTQFLSSVNGNYTADEIDNVFTYRIGDKDGFYNVEIVNSTPVPTLSPAPTNTPRPTHAYAKEKDAIYTFAVVKNVSSIVYDGDDAYKVDALIRGNEESFIISLDAPIAAASDYYSSLEGKTASALKMGDIVYIPVGLNGKTKNFALVHRPLNEDIITSSKDFGENFEKLISKNGIVYGSPNSEPGAVIPFGSQASSSRYSYAFGVVTDKYKGGFTLRNKSGLLNNAIDVSLTDDTIVYICNMEGRGSLSINSGSAIVKSSIPRIAYDEEENITYSSDYSYNYAFARIIEGVATEVVIYTNYNE